MVAGIVKPQMEAKLIVARGLVERPLVALEDDGLDADAGE